MLTLLGCMLAAHLAILAGACDRGEQTAPPSTSTAPEGSTVRPVMVPQIGALAGAAGVAFSPDGRLALSAGADGVVKLWAVDTGLLLRSFRGHEGAARAVVFTPDGLRALSGGEDDALRLWDIRTGEQLKVYFDLKTKYTLWHLRRGIESIALSPDGRHAYSAGADGLKYWDLAEEKVLERTAAAMIHSVAISPDGRYATAGADAKTVALWSIESGEVLHHFDSDTAVSVVAFSPDGHRVVVGDDSGFLRLWDVESGRKLRDFERHGYQIVAAAFSPDGRRLLSSAHSDEKARTGGFRIWNVETGEPALDLERSGHGGPVAFSRDGRYVLSGGDPGLNLWDATSGRLVRAIRGTDASVQTVGLEANGRHAFVATRAQLQVWDLETAALVKTLDLPGAYYGLDHPTFSPDMSLFLTPELQLRDMKTGALVRQFEDIGQRPLRSVFSGNGSRVLADQMFRDVNLFDVASGRRTRSLKRPRQDTTLTALSPDGRRALVGSGDPLKMKRGENGLELWDVEKGEILQTHPTDGWVSALVFSPDGEWALSANGDLEGSDSVSLWKVDGLIEVLTFGSHAGTIRAIAFLPDGRSALTGGDDRTVARWNLETGKRLRTFAGHDGRIGSIAVSADGRLMLSGSDDGTARLWRVEDGHWMAMLSLGQEWLVYNDEGYFDASRHGGELIAAVRGLRGFRVDQIAARTNRPDMLLSGLGIGSEPVRAQYEARHAARLAKLGLLGASVDASVETAPEARIEEATQEGKVVTLVASLSDASFDLLRYNVYVNNVPLFGALGKDVSGRAQRVTERVELTTGRNKIEIGVLNRAGVESLRDLRIFDYDGPVRGALYFLGFGVSHYEDTSLRLDFANKDVMDLADVLRGATTAFEAVQVRTYTDAQVTLENIRRAKRFLARAGVDDTVVLMVSGHGMSADDKAHTYYYLTHATDVSRLAETAASFDVIEDLLQGIAPRRKLFLMDTCEAGDVEEVDASPLAERGRETSMRPKTARGVTRSRLAPAARYSVGRDRYIFNDIVRRSGAVVLSSSAGTESSYESAEIQNGVFTEEVMLALTTNVADRNGDRNVSLEELRAHVSAAVERRTGGAQHPTIDRDNVEMSFTLPLLLDAAGVVTRTSAPDSPPIEETPNDEAAEAHARGGCTCQVSRSQGSGLGASSVLAAAIAFRLRTRTGPRERSAKRRAGKGDAP